MKKVTFTTEAFGYSFEEVDRYIQMLQSEYENAVQWANELEKDLKFEKESSRLLGENVDKLVAEKEKLHADCKILASKLKEMTTAQPEEKVNDAGVKATVNDILAAANQRAKEIVDDAYEMQNTIFSSKLSDAKKELEELESRKKKVEADIANYERFVHALEKSLQQALSSLRDLSLTKNEN